MPACKEGGNTCISLSSTIGTRRVRANEVYQEYIKDKNHYHMNATRVRVFKFLCTSYRCTCMCGNEHFLVFFLLVGDTHRVCDVSWKSRFVIEPFCIHVHQMSCYLKVFAIVSISLWPTCLCSTSSPSPFMAYAEKWEGLSFVACQSGGGAYMYLR